MSYPHILHHGAIAGVTGSCYQLRMNAQFSLGLFQGGEVSPVGGACVDNLAIDFPLNGIRALVVTYVHIDRVGRIPYLLAAGFNGPTLCSEASVKLLPIVLEDAFKCGFSYDQQPGHYIRVLEQCTLVLSYLLCVSYQAAASSGMLFKLMAQVASMYLSMRFVTPFFAKMSTSVGYSARVDHLGLLEFMAQMAESSVGRSSNTRRSLQLSAL